MKKSFKLISILLIAVISSLSAGCAKKQKSEPVTLYISAAASLKDSMDEIKQLYAGNNPAINLIINYGSSGTLQQQIEQGAEVDIFVSAAAKQMDTLENKELIVKDTRKNLLQNEVVLVVPKDNSSITSINDLITDKVNMIALGETKSVPAGQYAEEIFTKLGIIDKVKTKAVYAKDVKQVLTWVETGNADAGIVYTTDAKTSDKIRIVAAAPAESHSPVIYPAAVIKATKKIDAARDFMKFLSSDKAKGAFEKYGFKVNVK